MNYFAKIDADNIVVNVIVALQFGNGTQNEIKMFVLLLLFSILFIYKLILKV